MNKINNNKPILILSAMKIECELILKKMNNKQLIIIDKYKYYKGKINNKDIILGIMGLMSINSTLSTYIAIKNFNPSFVILQGTAGSHNKNININDIIIGEQSINITRVITPMKEENEGSNSLEWNIINYNEKKENFIEEINYEKASQVLINKLLKEKYNHKKVIKGIIGSGDIWNNEIDKIKLLNKKYNTLCEDMETYSVYKICNKYNIPVISIRIISNNRLTKEDFNKNSIINLQEFILDLI